ncbi:liver-expressed antimicrobial peptide 2-like [Alligator sinensis]|uniref:Liver-expressed antimicrobial peptide 2-like n=1 Tax=Alligator sinensis TaxID=38654 RepID=A0A1U8D4A3_ALLSI|nr:liver-expressed antimicrobial peptide 2-like [Alligator sinensis]
MASVIMLWSTGTRMLLLICTVLLLLTSRQVTSSPAGSRALLNATTNRDPSPAAALVAGLEGVHTSRRLARMTPFWRTVGTKPIGAYCRYGLECSTKACRDGRCVPLQYES